MIPGDSLNSSASSGEYYFPDNMFRVDTDKDYELGSLNLNDSTGGLLQAAWTAFIEGNNIYIKKFPNGVNNLIVTTISPPTEVSFTFDSNMRPQIVYVEDGVTKLYWYDTSVGQFVTTEYSGIYSPRLSLDDKRGFQNAYRDILFFYIKTGTPSKLCYRQQRERYTVERELVNVPANTVRLGRIGMAKTNRFQVEFITL